MQSLRYFSVNEDERRLCLLHGTCLSRYACVQAAACAGTCGLSTRCPAAHQTLEEAAEERGGTGTTAGHPESADSGGLLVEPEPLTPLRNDLPSETPLLHENHF